MRISDWSSDVCSSDLEGRQPDTPAAFRKAKPSRNLFPHSGTAFSSNCVAAIPAQRVTTSRGEPNRLSPNSARRSRGDFRSAPRTRRVRQADRPPRLIGARAKETEVAAGARGTTTNHFRDALPLDRKRLVHG